MSEIAGIVKEEVVHSTEDETVYKAVLEGKIDALNQEEIKRYICERIANGEEDGIVFDMNAVTYVSSAGLRMFSAVNQRAVEYGKSYKLIGMREDILKLFQLTGYASAFVIEAKEE